MKKEYLARGTLGDTYIICCKLAAMGDDPVKVWHNTAHKYWIQEINSIYGLMPKAEVIFSDYLRVGVEEITSNAHMQDMDFFPKWEWPTHYNYTALKDPYLVIQPEAGKPKGYNHKELSHELIQELIEGSNIPCVILGTSSKFKYIKCDYNLIGNTSVMDAMRITSNAEGFIGPEGLLSFVALSYRVQSEIFYKSWEAIEHRIVGTPWEKFCYELAYIGGD